MSKEEESAWLVQAIGVFFDDEQESLSLGRRGPCRDRRIPQTAPQQADLAVHSGADSRRDRHAGCMGHSCTQAAETPQES